MINVIENYKMLKLDALDYCEDRIGNKVTYRQSGRDIEGVLIGISDNHFLPRVLVKSKTGKEYLVFIENLISIT
jgi:hypothetical protein